MIINESVLTEKELDFINGMLRRQPKQIALRVIALLLGAYFLFAAVLELLMLTKWKSGKLSDALLAAAFLIFSYPLLSRGIFLKFFSRRRSLKYKSLFAPRTYTADDGGITAHHSFEGTEQTSRFSFANADCFIETEDAVYLRFLGEKKQQIYMCLKDSGYREGSRQELLALLRRHGIKQT